MEFDAEVESQESAGEDFYSLLLARGVLTGSTALGGPAAPVLWRMNDAGFREPGAHPWAQVDIAGSLNPAASVYSAISCSVAALNLLGADVAPHLRVSLPALGGESLQTIQAALGWFRTSPGRVPFSVEIASADSPLQLIGYETADVHPFVCSVAERGPDRIALMVDAPASTWEAISWIAAYAAMLIKPGARIALRVARREDPIRGT